ncbi:apolipoprotein D-like [Penaeus japonicus]|uniref:apolipoprotein D-like n=1 Tax=Penaeus japonicus TaxID=27405 RepID=UPI001C710913|nr:apolipoprotein D-like [Penaeus japonicus]
MTSRVVLAAAAAALCGLLSAASARVAPRLEIGDCAEFISKPDFNLPEYVGRWYEIEKFDNPFQMGMECITADYTPIDSSSINVYNNGVGTDGEFIGIVGNASLINPEFPGEFQLNFAGRPAGRYNVLETDYVTFSAVYACTQLDIFKQEFAWVLAREAQLSPEVLQQARDVFSAFDIDVTNFLPTDQGETCVYTNPPEY